jgi:NitT/TauT family transport system permease protein
MKPRKKYSSIPALLFWIGVWWLGALGIRNPLLLPTPLEVFQCLLELGSTGQFWQTVALSIGRILLGVVTAVGLGVLLAILSTRSRLAELLIDPAITAMQATPVASFTILVLIWLDRDWVPVLICTMMALPVVFSGVSTGIRNVDPQLPEMARVFKLSRPRVLLRIWLPSVMPFFRTACSSALGLGWKAGIAAEVLTVPRVSMGRMIAESKLYLMTPELFAWTVTVVVLSLVLQRIMLALLKKGDRNA